MEVLEVFPIHRCPTFIRECCDLINSEWPRSISARLQNLFMSSDKFPTSLVLILNNCQVVGHVKLSEICLKGPEIMLESMIIHKDHRGKGWGKVLMIAAEKYIESRGKSKIFLSTRGQEGFYKKLGYEVCEPILFLGFCDTTPKGDEKVEKKEQTLKVKCRKIDPSVPLPPPPPPPPPLPKRNKIKPQVPITRKTYMSKHVDPEVTYEAFKQACINL